MVEKACRQCRRIVEEETTCPECGANQFTTFWRGYISIMDPEKSEISKKMAISAKGKHALRLSQ
jgi:DNA-directed RNA polymerase subunit E"